MDVLLPLSDYFQYFGEILYGGCSSSIKWALWVFWGDCVSFGGWVWWCSCCFLWKVVSVDRGGGKMWRFPVVSPAGWYGISLGWNGPRSSALGNNDFPHWPLMTEPLVGLCMTGTFSLWGQRNDAFCTVGIIHAAWRVAVEVQWVTAVQICLHCRQNKNITDICTL